MTDSTPSIVSDSIPTQATAVGPLSELTPPQVTALEWLTAGEPLGAAADAAGVHRTTVHRWVRYDPHFKAAYNAWHDQVHAAAQTKLIAMTDLAVGAVTKALAGGDARIAMMILKERGLIKSPPPGPTDPVVVAAEQAIESRNQSRRFADAEIESYR